MVTRGGLAQPTNVDPVDRMFQALSDPTRRDILRLVLVAEQSVSTLAGRYPMSFAAVQKHVAVLERAELVRKRRDRKSTRLNSSHANISYAVFCLKKKKNMRRHKN